MKAKKELIDASIQDGSMNRLNSLLSASHILLCEANNLIEEASDLMIERGICIGLLKKRHNDLTRAADKYFKEFGDMVTKDNAKIQMFKDLDDFDNRFRIWAKVYKNWKPKEKEE